MTPERWQRVQELYHTARARSETDRAAFLADACAEDKALRREVQALLDQPISTGGFVDFLGGPAPAHLHDAPGANLTGRWIGGYRVQQLLGRGGMGEVYRAHDTRLGRDVAIKVLPAAFTSDPGRLTRFGEPLRLTSDSLEKISPVFSPDGARIAYGTIEAPFNWDTWSVPVRGGEPQPWLRNASGVIWSGPRQLLFSEIRKSPQMVVVANGGAPLQVASFISWSRSSSGGTVSFKIGPIAGGFSLVVPVRPGEVLPPMPAAGLRSVADIARLPGARRVDALVVPGPSPDVYAFHRATTQRNLYRIPLR